MAEGVRFVTRNPFSPASPDTSAGSQRFTLSLNDSSPWFGELAGLDLSQPDTRFLRDLRAHHDATLPLSDLVECLQETVERLRAQTIAVEAIIAAAKTRLAQEDTRADP